MHPPQAQTIILNFNSPVSLAPDFPPRVTTPSRYVTAVSRDQTADSSRTRRCDPTHPTGRSKTVQYASYGPRTYKEKPISLSTRVESFRDASLLNPQRLKFKPSRLVRHAFFVTLLFSFCRLSWVDGRERAVRHGKPARMDGSSDGEEKTQALLEVPDARAGEGVPLQRVRVETEEVGAGAEPEPDREAGEDLVPEQTDEEQEELAETGGAATEQQQRGHEQPEPPRGAPPSESPRALAAPRGQPPRVRERDSETPPVTHGVLRGCSWPPPPRPGHIKTPVVASVARSIFRFLPDFVFGVFV